MSLVYFLAILPNFRHEYSKERNRTLSEVGCGSYLAIGVSYDETIGGDSASIFYLLPREAECGTKLDILLERVEVELPRI